MNKNKYFKLLTILVCTIFLASCANAQQPGTDSAAQGNAANTQAGTGSDESSKPEDVSLVSMKDVTYDNEDYYSDWTGQNPNYIKLNGTTASLDGTGAKIEGGRITISAAGVYVFSGKLDNGQIIVDSDDNATVRLVLNGAEINCSNSAPIYIKNAEKVIVTLQEGTQNSVTDGENYTFEDAQTDEPSAAVFSKADMVINGTGTLTVHGNYKDGIKSKDDLKITGGTMRVYSADDGITGKDTVMVKDGNIIIEAGGDGLKSTNDTDNTKGFVALEEGSYDIKSGADAIQAVTSVMISNGVYKLTTGGGSANSINNTGSGRDNTIQRPNAVTSETPLAKGISTQIPDGTLTVTEVAVNTAAQSDESESQSAKGIKSTADIIISGGTFTIDSSDDAIHSNNLISITDGEFSITSGDDGIHADSEITIKSGKLNITKSYEGIESSSINISGGDLRIVASDDGINAAGGNDGSSINGRPGQNTFASAGNVQLNISGGTILVNAAGDGIDSNGSIYMTNGTVLVNGPTNNGNGALDYNGTFEISGGVLIAAGSSGMAQAPSDQSTQYSVIMNFSNAQKAGTDVQLRDSKGNTVASFKPDKQYQSIVFSSPELKKDTAYAIYSGDTKIVDFTISKSVTWMSETGETAGGGFNQGGPGQKGGGFGKGGTLPDGQMPGRTRPDGNTNPGESVDPGSGMKSGGSF